MPSAKTTRIHDLPPPQLKLMALELFVDVPEYGISFELGTIKGYVNHYDAGDVHPYTGYLYVGDRRIDAVMGSVKWTLPAPNRGGAKPKIERDIAVFLARKYYEAWGPDKGPDNKAYTVDESVMKCWTDRRALSLKALSQYQVTRADYVEQELPLEKLPPKPKETHSGIGDVSRVSHAVIRAKKHLAETIIGVIGSGISSKKEDSLMILLLGGGGLERAAKEGDRAALHGPFWAWKFGEEEAEYFSEKDSFEVSLAHPAHPGWHVDKCGQLITGSQLKP